MNANCNLFQVACGTLFNTFAIFSKFTNLKQLLEPKTRLFLNKLYFLPSNLFIFVLRNQMNIDETQEDINLTKVKEVEEEDETLVLIQFTDLDDANYCEQFSDKFKSIDISNKAPIIQIGNRLYSGEYLNNIGTYLFFEENKPNSNNLHNPIANSNQANNISNPSTDSASSTQTNQQPNQKSSDTFNYFGKSYKKLVLSRLFVEERQQEKLQEEPN